MPRFRPKDVRYNQKSGNVPINMDQHINQFMAQAKQEMTVPFKLVNYGTAHYFPTKRLAGGLEELIIFSESCSKGKIPNGSVFVYCHGKPYDPAILKSDIGCGITSAIIPKMDFSSEAIDEIISAVDKLGIHIGQGNHFIDFTTGHPSLSETQLTNMIFIHSDFNNQNVIPNSFEAAKQLQRSAKEQRKEYLEKLMSLLGLNGAIYKDWTHNSIAEENGKMIYRKGAIDIRESQFIGALALNPIDGIYLYVATFEKYQNSMQHGTGRIGSRSNLFRNLAKKKGKIARVYLIGKVVCDFDRDPQLKKALYDTYNSEKTFHENFQIESRLIGYCIPELMISTKI